MEYKDLKKELKQNNIYQISHNSYKHMLPQHIKWYGTYQKFRLALKFLNPTQNDLIPDIIMYYSSGCFDNYEWQDMLKTSSDLSKTYSKHITIGYNAIDKTVHCEEKGREKLIIASFYNGDLIQNISIDGIDTIENSYIRLLEERECIIEEERIKQKSKTIT